MSSYIKKAIRTSFEKKSPANVRLNQTATAEIMNQEDHYSPESYHPRNKESSERLPSSKIKKTVMIPYDDTKSENLHKELSSNYEDSTVLTTPFSNTTNTSYLSSVPYYTTTSNKNGPDEKYQINSHLLFEHSFPGQTFISVHLQRLQHGVYSDANLHTKHTLHVTFAALNFIFHPSTPTHRFESAVIEIKVKDKRGNLRFLRYAPHQAYGRISTESLKWNFQLGASLGVTQGPAHVSVNPSVSEEKTKVVGAMMKIQGSTRSTSSHSIRHPDTLLHFSLEENIQQESGLPREFTFVFLLERPSEKQYPPVHTFSDMSRHKRLERRIQDKLKSLVGGHEEDQGKRFMKYEFQDAAGERKTPRERLDEDLEGVFGEVELEICVDPKISNTLKVLNITTGPETQTTLVAGEVGQKFPTEGTLDSVGKMEHPEVMVDGLYNFAKLAGALEEMVGLPGISVGSRVPQVGDENVNGGLGK